MAVDGLRLDGRQMTAREGSPPIPAPPARAAQLPGPASTGNATPHNSVARNVGTARTASGERPTAAEKYWPESGRKEHLAMATTTNTTAGDELHVIFGTGPLGLATARVLVARGKRVRMVNRSGRAPDGQAVPARVEIRRGDATDPASTREVCTGATAVYQCAQPAYTEWVEKFPPLQAGVLEGAAAVGAKLIVAENLYMYGPHDGPLTEELPYAARTRKGETRARMAEAVSEAHRGGKVRTTAGRGADFFGPGVLDSVLGERVFPPLLAGKRASAIGNIDLPHTYTFIEDFGRALATLGEREEALGQAWHVPNAETRTTRQLVTLAFEQAGLKPKVSGMGGLMMRLGGLVIPEARETVEMMYEFERPFVVDHGRYARAFGGEATPHPEAIERTLDWYRTHAGGH
ncbi:MAG: NAD-dependent epimerase/dehydratase [uncultured Thermomicrobiales bacterium]|uniref:NAD-dependent epimerase/dehydratase n=1 Tax=uncultured Thermomicrobiales bacterium TaxID=1645740 RepID=A0A6J4UUA7_9BACT|nr:MAG: NAD-dependent epimerase/dehydratase [uncultured Thermomicrobiales bacterium]